LQIKQKAKQARILTYLGTLPFWGCLTAIAFGIELNNAAPAWGAIAHSYAVIIISFLAGIHWALFMSQSYKMNLFIVSNVFALIGWFSLLDVGGPVGLTSCAGLFGLLFIIDRRLKNDGLISDFFYKTRRKASVAVISILLAIAALVEFSCLCSAMPV